MGQPRRRHTIEENDRTKLAERFQHAGIACSLLSAVILLFSVFGGRADTNAAARSASSSPGREAIAAEGTDRPVFLARNWDEEIYPAAESAEAAGAPEPVELDARAELAHDDLAERLQAIAVVEMRERPAPAPDLRPALEGLRRREEE